MMKTSKHTRCLTQAHCMCTHTFTHPLCAVPPHYTSALGSFKKTLLCKFTSSLFFINALQILYTIGGQRVRAKRHKNNDRHASFQQLFPLEDVLYFMCLCLFFKISISLFSTSSMTCGCVGWFVRHFHLN